MKKSLILFFLILNFFEIWAQLPKLSEAREAGRTKSKFLTNSKKTNNFDGPPEANLDVFNKQIKTIIEKNCVQCHGPKKKKGKFRIDELNPDLLSGEDTDVWLEVYAVISNYEMPPEDEPDFHINDENRQIIIDWLGEEIQKAAIVKKNSGAHSSLRRMTKFEYNNALQDLLGLPYKFADDLPPETMPKDGFSNSSDLLQITGMQFELYRELGLKALQKATVNGPKPELITYNIPMTKAMGLVIKNQEKGAKKKKPNVKLNKKAIHILNKKTDQGVPYGFTYRGGKWGVKPDKALKEMPPVGDVVTVIPQNKEFKLDIGDFLPMKGDLRVRVRVGRTSSKANQYSNLRLSFGGVTSNNANFLTILNSLPIQGTVDKPDILEFMVPLGEVERNPFIGIQKLGDLPNPSEVLTFTHLSNNQVDLHIDYIEILAPFYKQWPPVSHRQVFIDSANKNNPKKYTVEILEKFMSKAWRRPVSQTEVARFVNLHNTYSKDLDFEKAMLETLATVLASPEFLYIIEEEPKDKNKSISDLELANRLAIFLWSSIPDEELIDLAGRGQLSKPKVLEAQVQRMLADTKTQRFQENFTKEWLGLHNISGVKVDKSLSSRYDESLKTSIIEEPIAYFAEVLAKNHSIIDFIHSNYIMINERLARHYGIKGVYGPDFRRVAIKTANHRGGILTGAGVMTINGDGKDSNPLKRGIWLLEKILHDPPPPPPPDVPQVDLTDPRVLEMTMKERLEDHRKDPACISCHAKIDPWGIAFENYNALGQFVTRYGNKKPIDASSQLFNKQNLNGITGLKGYLLSDRQDQFAKAMVYKMTSYALGRPLSFSDHADIEDLTRQLRKRGDGLGDLVSLITQSQLFQTK